MKLAIDPKDVYVFNSIRKYSLKNAKVLDVGCGGGRTSFMLASLGYRTLGVDISNKAIGYAKENYTSNLKDLDLKFEVIKDLKDIKGKYDVIILMRVLEHVDNPRSFLESLNKLLKSKSILIIGIPNGYCLDQIFYRFIKILSSKPFFNIVISFYSYLLEKSKFYEKPIVKDSPHKQYFTYNQICTLLIINNLEIIERIKISFLRSFFAQVIPILSKKIRNFDNKISKYLPLFMVERWRFVCRKN